MFTIAKGQSGIGGNSPIGNGELTTLLVGSFVGVFSWSIFPPAGERWKIVSVRCQYFSGSTTTAARLITLNAPDFNVVSTFLPNINETTEFNYADGIPESLQYGSVPGVWVANIPFGSEIWLDPGETIGMTENGLIDPDTAFSFVTVRYIKYDI